MASIARTIRRLTALACVLPLAAGTLTACGGDSNDSSSSPSGAGGSSPAARTTSGSSSSETGGGLSLTAQEHGEDDYAFSKHALTAKVGTVTIDVANPGSNEYPHGIAIEGNGVDKDGEPVSPGGTATVTATLKPGTYTFYCPVPEHEGYGMKGKLTVS